MLYLDRYKFKIYHSQNRHRFLIIFSIAGYFKIFGMYVLFKIRPH